MANAINHDLRVVDGATIYMPPWKGGQEGWGNLAIPDVFVTETTATYPIGTRMVDGDRTFVYSYVGGVDGTYTKANIGLYCAVVDNASLTMGTTAHAAGTTAVIIADAASAVNAYAGGFFMPRTNPYSSFRILSNTVSDGTHVTLTLERGTLSATTASQGSCHVVENPYSDVRCTWGAGRDDVSFLGITLLDTILTTYQWILTWGPCHVVPYNEEMGAAANVQMANFHIDGTAVNATSTASRQKMGFAIPHTGTTSTWYMMVQVAP